MVVKGLDNKDNNYSIDKYKMLLTIVAIFFMNR